MQLPGELLKRWRRGLAKEWERWSWIWYLCPCQIILPHKSKKPAVKICFSTLPLTSVINCRKSPHCRHTGKISRNLSHFHVGAFFSPLWGVEHGANKFASEKKLAWRSCFIIFLLLFCNSQCGNIRLSLESILLQDVWEPQIPSEAKLQ